MTITVSDKIMETWLYEKPEYVYYWLDICFEAGKEKRFNIGGRLYRCKPNETIQPLSYFAKRWNVSKTTTHNFIKKLKAHRMIKVEEKGIGERKVNAISLQAVTLTSKRVNDNKTEKNPSFSDMKNTFCDVYFEKFEMEYIWSAKDAVNIHELIKKLTTSFQAKQKREPEHKELIDTFNYILRAIKDPWILNNFNVSIINLKFTDIIAQIKSGYNGKPKQQLTRAEKFAAAITGPQD